MRKVLLALRLLLSSPVYLFLAVILSFVLFVIYFVLNDLQLFRSALSINTNLGFLWEVLTNHVSTVWSAAGAYNVLAVGLVSFLGGINLSLTILRVKRTGVFIGRASLPGFLGTLGGAFAASCSACSTALISLLGISGSLAVLPFGGLEISLLAIILLLASLYYVSKSFAEFGILLD